jgi:hypothetical protein
VLNDVIINESENWNGCRRKQVWPTLSTIRAFAWGVMEENHEKTMLL